MSIKGRTDVIRLSSVVCIAIFLGLFSNPIKSTTYIPVDFYDQIKESDGVIHGIFKGQTSKKLQNDMIVTVNSFEILEATGIIQSSILNIKDFSVYTPGGIFQGINQKVDDFLSFSPSEEVVLLLKKTPDGYFIHNLGLGKYQVLELDGQRYLRSVVFPHHKNLNRISFESLNEFTRQIFGEGLSKVDQDKYVYKGQSHKQESQNRGPASAEVDPTENNTSGLYWLVIIFAIMGLSRALWIKMGDSR